VHDAIQDFAYFLRSNSPRKAAIAFYVVISGQWDYPKPQRFPSNNLFGGKQREAHQRQASPAWTAPVAAEEIYRAASRPLPSSLRTENMRISVVRRPIYFGASPHKNRT
jgi:hypothetical protein